MVGFADGDDARRRKSRGSIDPFRPRTGGGKFQPIPGVNAYFSADSEPMNGDEPDSESDVSRPRLPAHHPGRLELFPLLLLLWFRIGELDSLDRLVTLGDAEDGVAVSWNCPDMREIKSSSSPVDSTVLPFRVTVFATRPVTRALIVRGMDVFCCVVDVAEFTVEPVAFRLYGSSLLFSLLSSAFDDRVVCLSDGDVVDAPRERGGR